MDGQDAAYEAAVKLLARRALGEAGLRERLLRKGHPAEDVDRALVRLARAGYLDDQRVALEVILQHSRRGHGPVRVLEKLRACGIRGETVARAWEEAAADYGVDPRRVLKDQVRRRLPRPGSACDEATLRRVYNALLRAGFEEGDVRSELGPYVGVVHDDIETGPAPGGATGLSARRWKEKRPDDDSQ